MDCSDDESIPEIIEQPCDSMVCFLCVMEIVFLWPIEGVSENIIGNVMRVVFCGFQESTTILIKNGGGCARGWCVRRASLLAVFL